MTPPPGTVLRLHLLGAPRAERDGAVLPLAVRKAWALLAVLALEGGATRARLAALLWPELDSAAARPSFCASSYATTMKICS